MSIEDVNVSINSFLGMKFDAKPVEMTLFTMHRHVHVLPRHVFFLCPIHAVSHLFYPYRKLLSVILSAVWYVCGINVFVPMFTIGIPRYSTMPKDILITSWICINEICRCPSTDKMRWTETTCSRALPLLQSLSKFFFVSFAYASAVQGYRALQLYQGDICMNDW